MHIGFITPEYELTDDIIGGGLAAYIRKVGIELLRRGNRVTVFVLSHKNKSWQDQGVAVYEIKSIKFPTFTQIRHLGPIFILLERVLSAQKLAHTVLKIHKISPLDILQTPSFMIPAFFLRRNKKIPLVCRLSSYRPLWRAAGRIKRGVIDALLEWLEVLQALGSDAVFAPSKFIAKIFYQCEGRNPFIIRTPVDFSPLEEEPSFYQKNLSQTEYLLFVGTLSLVKGADLFAQILPMLFKQHPSLHFVFVGKDEGLPSGEKIFDFIRSACSTFENRLHYFTPMTKRQMYPIIRNSRGVVLPSRVDNYPNRCLESLALGVPVIGTYDSSLEEIIEDGKTGFLAHNEDIPSLYAAIERLLVLGDQGREEIRKNILEFLEKIKAEDRIQQLLDFYKTAIENFKPNL